mmetsp:Transcript_30589/g.57234  ORF Transcript_30589/g.57234 Transcript_30589/m.57234 type:complete len:228 (+) Transcript_30589:271-954(+)
MRVSDNPHGQRHEHHMHHNNCEKWSSVCRPRCHGFVLPGIEEHGVGSRANDVQGRNTEGVAFDGPAGDELPELREEAKANQCARNQIPDDEVSSRWQGQERGVGTSTKSDGNDCDGNVGNTHPEPPLTALLAAPEGHHLNLANSTAESLRKHAQGREPLRPLSCYSHADEQNSCHVPRHHQAPAEPLSAPSLGVEDHLRDQHQRKTNRAHRSQAALKPERQCHGRQE